MKAVRWGIMGLARHFIQRVLLPLKKSALIELRAVASRRADKARGVAEGHGIPVWYASYEELLADPEVEAVYIPLPNHLHAPWIKRAAEAGKHILCEKPLALNAREATEGVEYARSRGVRLMEAFMYRFHPQWQRAKELVRVGEIGALQAVHIYFSYYLNDPGNIRNILAMGGGGLMDIGCYAVSVARFLLDAEPRRVISLIRRDEASGVDTLSSGLLDFAAGRSLFTVGTQGFSGQRVDLLGSAGRLTVQIPFNTFPDVPARVTVVTSIGSRELTLGPADHYSLEFEAFSRAIREDRPVPTPPEDAVNNQKVLDALFRSQESSNWEIP